MPTRAAIIRNTSVELKAILEIAMQDDTTHDITHGDRTSYGKMVVFCRGEMPLTFNSIKAKLVRLNGGHDSDF